MEEKSEVDHFKEFQDSARFNRTKNSKLSMH